MKNRIVLALAVLVVMCVPVSVSASQGGQRGFAVISQIDRGSRTVTLGGEAYRVVEGTTILNERGHPIGMNELNAGPSGATRGVSTVGDKVWYETVPSRSRMRRGEVRVLRVLRLVKEIPS